MDVLARGREVAVRGHERLLEDVLGLDGLEFGLDDQGQGPPPLAHCLLVGLGAGLEPAGGDAGLGGGHPAAAAGQPRPDPLRSTS